jgi:hypothetical protein
VVVVASTLASYACAQTSTYRSSTVMATKTVPSSMIAGTSTPSSQVLLSPCAIISSSVSAYLVANPEGKSSIPFCDHRILITGQRPRGLIYLLPLL